MHIHMPVLSNKSQKTYLRTVAYDLANEIIWDTKIVLKNNFISASWR